jgi:archaellum component FlaF (FlaF/FlaG flagellin family)
MNQWDPWQEMTQEGKPDPKEGKESNNKGRNRIIVHVLKFSTDYSSILVSSVLITSVILFYPRISAAKIISGIEDKEMMTMSAWEYSKSFLSSKAWFSFFRDRKLSPEFHKYVSPAIVTSSLLITTGIVTYLSTSTFYENIVKGQQVVIGNLQQEILNSNVLCENKLFTANFLCETKLLEKVNLCKNRFTKSNLSWADLVLKKDIEFDKILIETQKLCKINTK